jgi:hypothetical protein
VCSNEADVDELPQASCNSAPRPAPAMSPSLVKIGSGFLAWLSDKSLIRFYRLFMKSMLRRTMPGGVPSNSAA